MIAMALALNPKLLIADEPTTALDVTVQAQILQLIKRVQQEFGTAVILITHDLGVIADVAERVIVMYAGKPMEYADKRTLYHEPHHPYTEGLIGSLPQRGTRRETAQIHTRSAAEPAARARRMPVPPALRLRHATLPDRRTARPAGRRRRGTPVRVLAPAGCHRHERQQCRPGGAKRPPAKSRSGEPGHGPLPAQDGSVAR